MELNRCFMLSACFMIAGCANYATLQDASTLPEGEHKLGLAGTFTSYGLEAEVVTTTTSDGETVETRERFSEHVTVPALLLFARAGLTDRLELHGAAWFPFGASLGIKYMLLGEREGGFVLSPGLDVTMPVQVSVDDESALFMDAIVPLHLGYRMSPGFAVYVTPKYALRILGSELNHLGGSTLGFAIGKSTRLLVEGTVMYDPIAEDPTLNGALGVAF